MRILSCFFTFLGPIHGNQEATTPVTLQSAQAHVVLRLFHVLILATVIKKLQITGELNACGWLRFPLACAVTSGEARGNGRHM